MGATKSQVVRYGLPFVGGLVGFAIAGGLGLGLGMGLVLAGPAIWWLFRNRREVRAEYRKGKATYGESGPTTHRLPIASRIMVWAILSFSMLFILYSAAISFGHHSRADIEWVRTVQPGAEWLSNFVPALRRMPLDLIERGQGEWALAAQHVLFVGWLLLPLILFWIAVDVLVVNRHSWNRACSSMSRRGSVTMLLSCAILFAGIVTILFFGLTERGFGGVVRLPMLAGGFLVTTVAFFMLTLSCNALVTWFRPGGDPANEQVVTASPLVSNMMRRALAWHIFGRMLGGKSDRH